MTQLDKQYWNQRYTDNLTGWDIGYPSTPIREYIDALDDLSLKILIPGAGNAYEAEYAYQKGFKNTYILDISEIALSQFKLRCPHFPEDQCINTDFFEHEGSYDLILEQTFFCALDPGLRCQYVKAMSGLLNANGVLAGVLFDFALTEQGPPFGGSKAEYTNLFKKYFNKIDIKRAMNSIPPRQGSELFFTCKKDA